MASPLLVGRPNSAQMGLLSAALPSPMGDMVGLLADGLGYAENPKSLTLGNGLLSLAGLIPGVPSKRMYHGGEILGDIKPGIFLTDDAKYAENFVKSHGKGKVYSFDLPDGMKVYPEPIWWQDYKNVLGGPDIFRKMGYDAVRVMEPAGRPESLSIVNPSVLRAKQ